MGDRVVMGDSLTMWDRVSLGGRWYPAPAPTWWESYRWRISAARAIAEALFGWMRGECPCGHAERSHMPAENAFRWCGARECQCQEYRGE